MDKLKTLMAACKRGVYVSVNPHRDGYETVERWLENQGFIDGASFGGLPPETRAEMIRLNTVVNLHFYPDTPVGFFQVLHFNLDAALDEALGRLEGPIPQTLRSETEVTHRMPPPEIVAAAEAVGRWFDEQNIEDWSIGPCTSRRAAEKAEPNDKLTIADIRQDYCERVPAFYEAMKYTLGEKSWATIHARLESQQFTKGDLICALAESLLVFLGKRRA